jgi:hypothetical protein
MYFPDIYSSMAVSRIFNKRNTVYVNRINKIPANGGKGHSSHSSG